MYSPVRPVVFDDEIKWQVFPNPSKGAYNFTYQLNQGEAMTLKVYDVTGKLVKQTNLTGNGFVQTLEIDLKPVKYVPVVYLLIAESVEKKYNIRLIKQ